MRKVINLFFLIILLDVNLFAQHTIGSGDLSTCSGNLFDTGGMAGSYSDNESFTETYCSNGGNCISVNFSSFATESCCDYLRIYDGSSTGDPLIGTYQGTSSPGTISSSTGCLTFEWYSDYSATDAGWQASISCSACPTCDDPSTLSVSNILYNGADLSWTENGTATQWDIEWGFSGFVPSGIPNVSSITSNPYSLTGLTESTNYDFYVRSNCSGALVSNWVGPFSFSTVAPPAGSTCGNPNTLNSLPYSSMGMSTNGFGDDYSNANACGSSYMEGDDYVFEYTPSGCEEITISINNADSYSGLFLTEGCPTTGSCVNSSTGSAASISSQLLQGGKTYYIIVSTWPSPQYTSFDINISSSVVSCPGDVPCSAVATSTDCGAKISNAIGGFSNSGVADPSCGNYQGGDVWYELTIPASGTVDIKGVSVESGVADLALAAYTSASCGGSKTLVGCDDDGAGNGMPLLSLSGLSGGNTLYVRVWGPGNNSIGEFELEFTDPSSLYCLNGDASMYNFPTDTCMEMTPDANSQRGCAWYQNTLDFSQSFDHALEVYCGNDDGGADGMTFTFHNDLQGTTVCGNDGQYLGAGGIQNSLVIEVDTWDNGGSQDIAADHISIWTSKSGEGSPIAGPISATSPASNIEDGNVHELRLVWDANTNTLEVYFDGVFRLSATDDFINNVFGSKNVFWGSTGSTGGASNQYYVCPPNSLINPSLSESNFDFEIECSNDFVEINIKNQNFDDLEYMEVQKSFDGINFKMIERFFEESSFLVYGVQDESYLRLKRRTRKGAEHFSKIKEVSCWGDKNGKVWSNNGILNIDIYENESSNVKIFTLEGKILIDKIIVNDFEKIDVSDFSSGIYFVEIKNDSYQKVQKVFIKNIAE